ncbi:MAG TPA: 2-dehydropantoate 2-reductase [Allosphingosinicella sp.]|nr:2-dehydropantoate 2-reductase [Allosphingosinicella sp.]
MADSPQIVVLGAGSVGCFVGGAWASAGLDVSFVGRDEVASEVAKQGITLSDQEGWKTHIPPGTLRFSTKPAALAKADIVLLTVKSTGTAAAARQIALHAKRKPVVISFQNGVSNVDGLKAALPKLQVLQGMVPYNVIRPGPGRWHRATWGELTAERHTVTERLSREIGERPGRLLLSDDMRGVAWGKLLFNLNNAINALSGMTILEELSHRDYRRVLAAAIVEALELLDAVGIKPAQIGQVPPKLLPHAIGAPDLIFKNLFLRIQKIDPSARGSMADDFAAGRPTEIDYLNGEVVKLAEKLGKDAPVNRAIVELVKQREAGVEHLWSAENLRKYVLEGHRGVAIFGY